MLRERKQRISRPRRSLFALSLRGALQRGQFRRREADAEYRRLDIIYRSTDDKDVIKLKRTLEKQFNSKKERPAVVVVDFHGVDDAG